MSKPKKNKPLLRKTHLVLIAVIIISAMVLIVYGVSSQQKTNNSSFSWTPEYFGLIGPSTPENEKQAYIDAFVAYNRGIGDACEIAHFYKFDCGACNRLEPWLRAFKVTYPEITITSYELHDTMDREKFEAKKKEYGITSGSVPSIYMCGSVLEGVETIQNTLKTMALAVYDLD
jgi:hypothetical protein